MKQENENDGFTINVNSPGNFIAREMTFNGTVNIGQNNSDNTNCNDRQVAQALENIVGDDQPIDMKWKWAGAYWWLRWANAYPVDVPLFCRRINGLPFKKELPVPCGYNDIRRVCAMRFMEYDPRRMDMLQPSSGEAKEFYACREVALRLSEGLKMALLPPEAAQDLPK